MNLEKTTPICGGTQTLLPESDHHFLVLLNCGHYEEENCYREYLVKQRQREKETDGYSQLITCPYSKDHWFPYPLARVKVGPQTDLRKLEQHRSKQLKDLIKNPESLVLLTCGHYLQLDCWNQYRRQEHLSCPYNPDHQFPIVTDLVSTTRFLEESDSLASSEETWSKMVEHRRQHLSDKANWAYEAFHFSGRFLPLQIRFSQGAIEANYHQLFQTNYYDGILTLRREYDLNRVLEWTVHNSEPELIKKVLPYVNPKYLLTYIDTRMNLFHIASLIGNLEVITALVEGLPDEYQVKLVNSRNFMNLNGLFYVARQGHYSVCRYLLQKGIEVNQMDGYSGRTPLVYAIERVNLPMVALILASERVNLAYQWAIQTGTKSTQVTSYAYHQLPHYYLGDPNTTEEKRFLDLFEGIFHLVDSGGTPRLNFHIIDREDTTKIVTLERILRNAPLCKRSSLPNELLQDLLGDAGPSEEGESSDELFLKVSNLDWESFRDDLVPLFETYEIKCLLCQEAFTTSEEILSSRKRGYSVNESPYDLIRYGFFHRQCPRDVGFYQSEKSGSWIIDAQSQYLRSFEGRAFTTPTVSLPEPATITDREVFEAGDEED